MTIATVRTPRAQIRRQLNIRLTKQAGGSFTYMRPGFNGRLEHSGCRFIAGDPVTLLHAGLSPFCGKPTRRDSPYCEAHHLICFIVVRIGLIKAAA